MKYCWSNFLTLSAITIEQVSDCKGIHAEQQDFSTSLAPFTDEEELLYPSVRGFWCPGFIRYPS